VGSKGETGVDGVPGSHCAFWGEELVLYSECLYARVTS
jgi:hypothetical protein